jgi:hypothetical protein
VLHIIYYDFLTVNMENEKSTWGRKKEMVIFTVQGKFTQKQYEKIQKALLKIAVRYDVGYGEDFE